MNNVRCGMLYNSYNQKVLRFVRISITPERLAKVIKQRPLPLAA